MPDPGMSSNRSRKRFILLTTILVLLNGLGLIWIRQAVTRPLDGSVAILTATPANGSVTTDLDHISLRFDGPVVTPDAVEQPVDDPPFVLRPRRAGQWIYATPERLEFRLDEPLPPGTAFTVEARPDAEQRLGRSLRGAQRFSFTTGQLAVDSCLLLSCDGELATFALSFNQPVAASDLARQVRVLGKPATLLTQGTRTEHHLQSSRGPGDRIDVVVYSALAAAGGHLGLDKTRRYSLSLPKHFVALRAKAYQPSTETLIEANVRFSSELDRSVPPPAIIIEPTPPNLVVNHARHGLRLRAQFAPGQRYQITLPASTLAKNGQVLGESVTLPLAIPNRRASLKVPAGSGVLSPRGAMQLDLVHVGVNRMRVAAARVHESNLVEHLHGGNRRQTARTADAVFIDLPRSPDGNPTRSVVDLKTIIDGKPGLWSLEFTPTGHRWSNRRVVVNVTDLALTTKRSAGGITVWLTSLHDGRPVEGATVIVRSYNNQPQGEGKTDANGLLRLALAPDDPDGAPWLVTATTTDGDACYVHIADTRSDNLPNVANARSVTGPFDLYLAPEREIVRPGNAPGLIGLLRTADGLIPPPCPLELKLHRPDGREVNRVVVTPGPTGFFTARFTTQADDQTGRYRITAHIPGDDDTLARLDLWIEPFVPARLAVQVNGPDDITADVAEVEITSVSSYLRGAPATDLRAKLITRLSPIAYQSAAWPDYRFSAGSRSTKTLRPAETQTDTDGRATFIVDMPKSLPPALWWIKAAVTTTEVGGRGVTGNTMFRVDTAGRHLGTHPAETITATSGAPWSLDWVLLDTADFLIADVNATATAQRIEREWVLKRVNGDATWVTEQQLTPIADAVQVDPPATDRAGRLRFTAPAPGRYRITINETGGATTTLDVTATASGGVSSSGLAARPDRIDLELDQATYGPGDTANVVIHTPFAGTLLLAIESHIVHDVLVQPIATGTSTIALPIPTDVRGGAFVTATVVREVDPTATDWLAHRAHGAIALTCDRTPHILPLVVTAPDHAAPGTTITVECATESGRPASIVIWAVDEGIVRLTDMQLADPLDFFLAPRRLGVTTADRFDDLLPDHQRSASFERIGADLSAAAARRRNPIAARVAPSAVIAPHKLEVGPDGRANWTVQVPELTGALRFFALAADEDRYAATTTLVTVEAPLLVESSWPAALAPGDSVQIPIRLSNRTESALSCQITFDDLNPTLHVDPIPEPVNLGAGASTVLWTTASAEHFGAATPRVHVVATGTDGSLVRTDVHELTVRPSGPLDVAVQLFSIVAGETLRLETPPGFNPERLQRSVTVSDSPLVELEPALRSLMDYPYGCVEQTSSRLLALLAAEKVGNGLGGASLQAARRDMIASGMSRLRTMRTPAGGLSYWSGGTQTSAWGSVHALDVLGTASELGVSIPEDLRDDLIAWATQYLATESNLSAQAGTALALARFGAVDLPTLALLESRQSDLTAGDSGALAHAFTLLGRRDRAAAVLAKAGLPITVTKPGRGAPHRSATLAFAAQLEAVLQLDPDDPRAAELVTTLLARRKNAHWANTYEDGVALRALAGWQKQHAEPSAIEAQLTCGALSRSMLGADAAMLALNDSAAPVTIVASGSGRGTVMWRTEGERLRDPKKPLVPTDHGLEVRRQWLDAAGNLVDPGQLRVGDLIVVEVTLRSTAGEAIPDVAVVDRLPGGFEIENPHLHTTFVPGRTNRRPSRVEFRADRVILFATAKSNIARFRYALRITAAGNFARPPIEASSMYDGQLRSIQPAPSSRLQVQP